jgi:3-methyladenine DNA glycosylase AlkD
MHKALGWMLREAGKIDDSRLKSYLLKKGKTLPRISVRYAIERFTEGERKKLLKVTKPESGF